MSQLLAISRPADGLRKFARNVHQRGAALWRAYPRETIGAGLFGVVSAVAAGAAFIPTSTTVAATPPAPPPMLVRQIAPDQAVKVNEEIPVVAGPNPAAAPFKFTGNSAARTQALQCLASAVYYEAGSQDDDGQRAVAQVVLNRVRHPAFPGSVCGVVYEGSTRTTGCQFTFTCDGSMYRTPDATGWRRAYKTAEAALAGSVFAPVGWATHYHANYVVPYWASTLAKSAIVGAHIFYRWAGGWGQPGVFSKGYAGREPNAAALRTAALSVVHVAPLQAASGVAALVKEIPGAEALPLQPSMRGDKRVAVRFNLAARKAADEATHEEYTKKFEASDNLKWTLSTDSVAQDEKPLGRPAATAAPATAAAPTSSTTAAASGR